MIREFTSSDLLYIILSTKWTIGLSLMAFVGGGTVGAFLAFSRTARNRALRWASGFYISFFQGTPLLLQLFVAFFVPSSFGIQIAPWTAAALGLSLNAGAFLGEIWRGSIQAVPKGQWEAAAAVGLKRAQIMILVIVPQAVRMAIPPTVGFLVQLVKATSLASIIGFTELTRSGQILINSTYRPFLIFSIIAVIYFLVCWPLSRVAIWLERAYDRRPQSDRAEAELARIAAEVH